MALILCFESTADICSVALTRDSHLLSLHESTLPNAHSELITILAEKCLQDAGCTPLDLDAVAVSDGPGSYTSLRVGLSVAKGMAFALDIPLITIDSLEIIMHGIPDNMLTVPAIIIPLIDARRKEVYASVYDNERKRLFNAGSVILDENWYEDLPEGIPVYLCGSGAVKTKTELNKENYILVHTHSSAAFMLRPVMLKYESAQFSDIAYHTPNYIKSPNITESRKKYF
jgi:tRNA threonylcarbamoyladenosine biosynthesis protein TsaB